MIGIERKRFAVLGLVAACGLAAGDPPSGYYSSATSTDGATLKSQLTSIVSSAGTISYGDMRTWLQIIDEHGDDPGDIYLVYNNWCVPSTWDQGATWNREHAWPRSLGVGSSGSDNSDAHMLWPCNPSVNGSRGNKAFGTAAGRWDPDKDVSLPVENRRLFRGRMARMAFYANTRYTYLNMALIGTQSELVDWHFDQMPDAYDDLRNDRITSSPQGNRNPYVDHPEWVWAIFGDGASDAQVFVMGDVETDGSSTLDLDLGARIGLGAIDTSVTLSKSGAAPTTYLVSSIGDVDVAAADGRQRGFGRGAQMEVLPISVNPVGFGAFAGIVEIDNTEITSAGSGQGASDGVDVIEVSGIVLDHGEGSLDPSSDVDSGSLDLGASTFGPVTIWNIADAALGADLEVTGVTISGPDAGAFGVNLMVGDFIPAGGSLIAGVTFNGAGADGLADATLTIDLADEDLPGGAADESLVVSLSAVVGGPFCPADLNDAAASSPLLPGFGAPDGLITATDFTAFVVFFSTNDLRADLNDATAPSPAFPLFGQADGLLTPTDFSAFAAYFAAGCPCTLPGCP